MGQYHTIYNKTKNETFSIGGAKLLEKANSPSFTTAMLVLLCNSNGRGGGDLNVPREYTEKGKEKPLKGKAKAIQEALEEVQGRWAGDEIVIQGDYAEESDPSFVTAEKLKSATNITSLIMQALEADSDLSEELAFERKFMNAFGRSA